jgi:hypothetical protein
LEADNYYFEPTFLRGTPGQKLKVEIENESGTLHNFSIPEQHLDVNIPRKGKVVAEVIQGTAHGFKDMKREDTLAIADYLKSIPAIKNKTK